MNSIAKKKLNLLVHLAKVDGRFHKSERELIKSVAIEAGMEEQNLDSFNLEQDSFDLSHHKDRIEVLYLALKVMQADQVVTEEELSFCRDVAFKLQFKPAMIDHYAHKPLPDIKVFESEIGEWTM